jgi:DNA-directed RNA polymerase specialized sigma24 family protein
LRKGRVHYFLGKQKQAGFAPIDYVYAVAGYYEQWHTHLHHIQEAKSADLWRPLYKQLQRRAYCYLLKRGVSRPEILGLELHIEYAAAAAERLLRANFPYDTAFDPWLTVLIQHTVDRKLRKLFKQTGVEADPVAAEQLDDWWNWLPDPASYGWQEGVGQCQYVSWAIDQLPSEAQQQVVRLHDLKGISYPDIARLLGKKTNAIYKLHHDAALNLKKILTINKDN